jgi:hypothetical protein
MADRCSEYCLGESIPENDLESLVSAIQRILSKSRERTHDKEVLERHDAYAASNNPEAVHVAMEWVLRSAGL